MCTKGQTDMHTKNADKNIRIVCILLNEDWRWYEASSTLRLYLWYETVLTNFKLRANRCIYKSCSAVAKCTVSTTSISRSTLGISSELKLPVLIFRTRGFLRPITSSRFWPVKSRRVFLICSDQTVISFLLFPIASLSADFNLLLK